MIGEFNAHLLLVMVVCEYFMRLIPYFVDKAVDVLCLFMRVLCAFDNIFLCVQLSGILFDASYKCLKG